MHHHREGSNPAECPSIKIVEGVGRFRGRKMTFDSSIWGKSLGVAFIMGVN